MQRRHFLMSTVAAPLAGAAGSVLHSAAWAAPAAAGPDARLLLVFLRGGYDALNLLVPAEPAAHAFYRELRPRIGVPLAEAGSGGAAASAPPAAAAAAATRLPGTDWALHPALAGSVLPLALAGQAVFVPYAGTDDSSRSHFETQDRIELGQGAGGSRDFSSGFLNRLALQLGLPSSSGPEGHKAIAFTQQLPVCLRGPAEVANVSLRNPPRAGGTALQGALAGMYQGTPLQGTVDEAFSVRRDVAQQMAEGERQMGAEMKAASRGAINTRGFEQEARRMARLMKGRYTLGFIDVGGWDTHVNQGAGSGNLAQRLEELGRGLQAYAQGLGEAAWRQTVVLVVSEFGRTVRENGNRGTDHGHGSVYWVLGGGLAAGPAVRGEQPVLSAETLYQNRDLPVANEYRALLGGLFARQFGLSPAALQAVFPGAQPRDLQLL